MARPAKSPSTTQSPEALDAHQALETLVHQFADPLSFLRELIQNSVDAGSPEVDIRFEYQESAEGGDGAMVLHVDDFGEGMDREIIDTKLTRLFSSTKEDDFTKIGRFGIGFVSVFALAPDAVCLDTSRAGENWRVLFRRDRTFERIARDEPVEGTKIRIIKTVPRGEYEKLRARARDVATFWCKHLPVPVRVDGEAIGKPFEVDAFCSLRHAEAETEVVVGYAADGGTFAGFYNRGLTLLETRDGPFPGVAFKISSRYLEHTLTRDNVLRDGNFDKAMAIVERLVRGPLPLLLFERFEQEMARNPAGTAATVLYDVASRQVDAARLPAEALRRRIFLAANGHPLTVEECRRAAARKRFYACVPDSPVGAALARDGMTVAALRPGSAQARALGKLVGTAPYQADELLCLPQPVSAADVPPGGGELCAALSALLRAEKIRLSEVALSRFAYPGSCIADRVAVTQAQAGEPTPYGQARRHGSSLLARKRVFALNADHPAVRDLAALAAREPELAAYLAAKLFFLGSELDPQRDARLAGWATEVRCRRRTA
jgi:molecular chaperone HtpG